MARLGDVLGHEKPERVLRTSETGKETSYVEPYYMICVLFRSIFRPRARSARFGGARYRAHPGALTGVPKGALKLKPFGTRNSRPEILLPSGAKR